MTLSDPQVAALARQAVDLLGPDIAIRIEPGPSHDPYGFGSHAWTIWPVIDRRPNFGLYVDSTMSSARALAQMLDGLGENVGETARFRGRAFPPCPAGHVHPADITVEPDAVVLRCPTSCEVADRIVPAV
jgi:hypothetical protein